MNIYADENHPNDSRATIDPAGIVQTLSSRMGTGGNNTPFVLIEKDDTPVCYAVDSHPGDSRIGIAGDICPTITFKIAKASSDGPLVLIRKDSALNPYDPHGQRVSDENGIFPTLRGCESGGYPYGYVLQRCDMQEKGQ